MTRSVKATSVSEIVAFVSSTSIGVPREKLGYSVPKLHVRHLFGRVRPRTWRFEEGLDRTKAQSVADVRADMVRNSEHCCTSKDLSLLRSRKTRFVAAFVFEK